MPYTSWRGVVGLIKPTFRPGSLEEFIRLTPEGLGVIPLFLDIQRGTIDEFREAINAYEEKVAKLAELEVDLIHPEGGPPFMLQGYEGERAITSAWEEKYGRPVVTSAQTQVEAMTVPFDRVGQISHLEVYAHTKKAFLDNPGADGILLFGSGWRSLDAIDLLEQDLGVPVVHAVTARVWAIERRLHIREPVQGYGRLLEEMP